MKEDIPRKQKFKFRPSTSKGVDKSWIIKTIIITFTMSAVFNVLSNTIMDSASIWSAVLILLFIIAVGIVFDIVGVAVTTATEAPFHSMASRHIKYADRAIKLIKAKDRVSNFCNDVIGDICGIISGSASATVVVYMSAVAPSVHNVILSLVITAAAAALTVGGKAIGKSVAIRHSNTIVYMTARVISFFNINR